jgi:signal transduction histidine kinase
MATKRSSPKTRRQPEAELAQARKQIAVLERQAQIEAALERVRARTMAMHKSDELSDAAMLMFRQVEALGIKTWACGFNIWDGDEAATFAWMSSPQGDINPPFRLPHNKNAHLKRIYAARNKEALYVEEHSGKKLTQLYQYLTSLPEFQAMVDKTMSAGMQLPEFQVSHNAYFSRGYLAFITLEPYPEAWDIFKRFARIFEQTYTRFLDLQKAEAQAREAQIQLALERVRARTMAMHKSDELAEVAGLLFKQVNDLGIKPWTTGFNVWSDDNNLYTDFITNPQGGFIEPYTIDTSQYPVFTAVSNAKKRGDEFYVHDEEGEMLRETYRQLSKFGEKQFEKILESGFQFPSRQIEHFVFGSKVSLMFITYEPVPEAHDIFKRFGKVFEQTYTRFLDLQKAEAQAREAQIEAALERVRSRTMAMQKSDELTDVAGLLFNQMTDLGIKTWTAGFNVWSDDNNTYEDYITSPKGGFIQPYIVDTSKASVLKEISDARKSGDAFFVQYADGERLKETYIQLAAFGDEKQYEKMLEDGVQFPSHQYDHFVFGSKVSLMFITYEPVPEAHDIFKRFGQVFEQTYTRFLDLKKAEAQAREAEIELGLERVRARAMAMQTSDELGELVAILFEELTKLDLMLARCIIWIIDSNSLAARMWMADSEDKRIAKSYFIKRLHHPYYNAILSGWKERKPNWLYDLKGDDKKTIDALLLNETELALLPEAVKQGILSSEETFVAGSFNNFGLIEASDPAKPTEEQLDILNRFGKVFDLSYTRFNDLKQAEAQAREAQIETALERVRSRTMAMHKSSELLPTADLLFDQLKQLGAELQGVAFAICDKNSTMVQKWTSIGVFSHPYNIDPGEERMYEAWKNQSGLYEEVYEGEKQKKYYESFMKIPAFRQGIEKFIESGHPIPTWQKNYAVTFQHGYLLFITTKLFNETQIFLRFGKVFEQTYTRFLDLQKAEAQAREAQIEAALERVRARAMAMHNSQELKDVSLELRNQMGLLGQKDLEVCAIHLYEEDDNYFESWGAIRAPGGVGKLFQGQAKFPKSGIKIIDEMMQHYAAGSKDYVLVNEGEKVTEWLNVMKEHAPEAYAAIAYTFENTPPEEFRAYWSIADFSGGALVMVTYSQPDENSRHLLRRCANVFALAYTRFLDLQKAEAQARQAIQQASLDRVRAEIASMRTAGDLQRITPLIWRELTALGVPFFRCGVFIIDEATEHAHVYLSTPIGEAVAALRLKFDSASVIEATVQHWRQQQVYREEWNREQFIAWTQSILKQGLIDGPEHYQAGGEAPQKLVLQFMPFAQGMLYIGSSAALSDEEIELSQSLAKAFGMAYARYEDFQRLEQAKKEIEAALEDLKKTQRQLIQAEKMASLGQLTAGIAHEIKNPLNFVNNFAELSVDLMKELREELERRREKGEGRGEKGEDDFENIEEILATLEQNAEKINHHGKRADGIVRAMMQHARGGKGERQPTDVNALVEEYINLTYHGMRAKVPDFNVTIERDFGELDAKIEMVPQDIGRVLLNLLSNAFDAVREHAKLVGGSYAPKVSLSTRAGNGRVEIRVSDNGGGIPDNLREKIFEPFFTTKPAGSGTGLGLSLAHDIVAQGHGGTLRVESTKGEGATFVVTLPAR